MKGKKLDKISSVYGANIHKTEPSDVAILMHWMREIIKDMHLDLGMPDVETSGLDRKRPDMVICESARSQRTLCVIEAKPPYYDVFDEKELKEPARKKATKRKAKYFAVTNFKRLIWFNTERVNSLCSEEEQIIEKYPLSELENLDDIEQTRYSEPIKRGLRDFLTKLYSVHAGKEPEPKQAMDEFLIFRLQEKIRVLSRYYRRIIDEQCYKDPSFAKKLKKWFVDQGWSFAWQPHDFDKAARQTAYLLVNKILFYDLLQAKRPHELDPLEIPEGLTKGAVLQSTLQGYFNEVLKIDYETIYVTDFIDSLAFPEAKEVVKEVRELVNVLKRYDFSRLGYDIIGRIFERLIPRDERHNLGQYFTSPDVVDLILRFCLHHEDDEILDPACGAGTFLVRAYQHKKLMNQYKRHEDILETLWGNDIAKFPAHLSTINLAINDLGVDKNYPNILQEDFFTLPVSEEGFEPEKWRKVRAKTLGLKEREVIYPRWFDAVVGNPPYTRQEEIRAISPEDAEYKRKLIAKALRNLIGGRIAELGKRGGIYTYFFVHGSKFLKDKGFLGFIVSNSWLDVDYGKGLQEFFLRNYKIITIIESKVERWFEEADINTCIIILQKCQDNKERIENLVRFVYLKKPLRHFIPPAHDIWEKQIERHNAIDKLKKTILAHSDFYENEELRIYPKNQRELWEEGFDPKLNKYVGGKWGKYVRAPKIFFKVLEKGKGKFAPLKDLADVRFGIKTGANEFFYLTEDEIKRRGIEKEFWMHEEEKGKWRPNYVIKSPRECKSIVVNPEDLNYRVLMIHQGKRALRGTNVLKYIDWGEGKGFQRRPTCAHRENWYDLGFQKPPDLIWFKAFNDRVFAPLNDSNCFTSDRFYAIYLRNPKHKKGLSCFLNSTLSHLIVEIWGRVNLGEGALDNMTYEAASMLTLDPEQIKVDSGLILEEFFSRQILSVFDEIGAFTPEEVSFDKIKSDRRKLDEIIMGKILGLTDDEQLEVYHAVVDLVKTRIEKARSFGRRKKTKEGIDIDALIKIVMDKIGDETLGQFYREKILTKRPLSTKTLPKASGEVNIESEMYGSRLYYSGRRYIVCPTKEYARYLKVFLEAGVERVKIPKDDDYLKSILPEIESLKLKITEVINSYLESIVDTKIKAKIGHQLWTEILK